MTALELRSKVIESRAQYHRGEIPLEAMYEAADAYIEALKEYRKRTGRKFSIPSRAYVLRAL